MEGLRPRAGSTGVLPATILRVPLEVGRVEQDDEGAGPEEVLIGSYCGLTRERAVGRQPARVFCLRQGCSGPRACRSATSSGVSAAP